METPKIYYADETATLWVGDAFDTLRRLPDGSVDCVVTSPPYFGLRDYGTEGQYGLEGSPAEYVETMRTVFNEARRVLADDGTLWLNLGDSYSATAGPQAHQTINARRDGVGDRKRLAMSSDILPRKSGLPPKNLLGIPWHVAFALQDDGWILRNANIWHKPNAMPSSVKDRLSNRYEHVFLFSKSARYWFDLDAIREPHAPAGLARRKYEYKATAATNNPTVGNAGMRPANDKGKNPGDVWDITTRSYPGAHFAVFPIDLPLRCINSGCRPGGTALDPFSGSGTTGAAALRLGRQYVGIDLNATYHDLAIQRFASEANSNPRSGGRRKTPRSGGDLR